jgi:hypothetical protein
MDRHALLLQVTENKKPRRKEMIERTAITAVLILMVTTMGCPGFQHKMTSGSKEPECKMGSDGRQTCGYNCKLSSNGHWYCASRPDGKCALNSDGTYTCM